MHQTQTIKLQAASLYTHFQDIFHAQNPSISPGPCAHSQMEEVHGLDTVLRWDAMRQSEILWKRTGEIERDVCMYVCMYACMYVWLDAEVGRNAAVRNPLKREFVRFYKRGVHVYDACMYVCMYVGMYVCMYVCMCD